MKIVEVMARVDDEKLNQYIGTFYWSGIGNIEILPYWLVTPKYPVRICRSPFC